MNHPAQIAAPLRGAPARAAAMSPARVRLDAIDLLRGLVMLLMVLDHTRDFIGASSLNPRDVHEPALFLTRWITHFCAPVFVLLAGVSAFLYGARGRTTRELSTYLFTRGLFLVLLELTLVRLGWTFSLRYDFVLLQVIWAIGASMILLSALVHLKRGTIAALALAMILGHNLLDGITADSAGWGWHFLHQPALLEPREGLRLFVLYPLVPWVGVMALGYVLGPVMTLPPAARKAWLLRAGVATTLGFVALRMANLYGDPAPWQSADGALATLLALLNCEKYPPSLLYLAMTLGPALVLLAYADLARGAVARAVITIGRVPLLFYVAHIFLLHAIAVLVAALWYGDVEWLFRGLPLFDKPAGYGLSLPAVYAVWLGAVAALYPACRGFAALKQRRADAWLSYL
jgi:uncharacterized membrane protein